MLKITKLLHVLPLTFFAFVTYSVVPGTTFFSWHPFLMTFAFVGLMFEAIKSLSKNSVFPVSDRVKKVRLHWLLQVFAAVSASIGFTIVYYNKIVNNKPHFVSWHAQLGLYTVVLAAGSSSGGLLALYPKLSKMVGLKPGTIKMLHASVAPVSFSLACASVVTGLQSDYFLKLQNNVGSMGKLMIVIPIILAVDVWIQVLLSYWLPKKKKSK